MDIEVLNSLIDSVVAESECVRALIGPEMTGTEVLTALGRIRAAEYALAKIAAAVIEAEE